MPANLFALLFLVAFGACGIVFLIWVLYHLQMDSGRHRHK